jgi:predicted membrane-bound dolichyl-phosphate-mannose-protein mannosyltransferase
VVPNGSLVLTQFIEIIELLRVQGPKNNIEAVGDYLCADGPFLGKKMIILTLYFCILR